MSAAAAMADPAERRLRVAIAARDPVRRRGLAGLIAAAGHDVCGSIGDADVLVADLDGDEAPPKTGFAALLVLSDDRARERDQEFPAVLPRAVTAEVFGAALGAAAAGLIVRMPGAVLPESAFHAIEEAAGQALLTPREIEVLAAIGEGLSNKAAARRLGISAHTVKFHLEAIFEKLGANSRAEALAKGFRRGVIEL